MPTDHTLVIVESPTKAKTIKSFLPKELSDEETKKINEDLILKLGASSIKDMGKVMAELKKKHADEIDFSKAGALLKQLLNK